MDSRKKRIVNGFLNDWLDPNEINFQLEDDTTPRIVEDILEQHSIEVSSKEQRQEYAQHAQSFEEPDYLAEVTIDGKYVAEDETPSLEDYVDMLTLEMNSEQVTETVNTLFNREVVTEDEVNSYLEQRENTEKHGQGNFYIEPSTEDERTRIYGLKQVLKQYHDDFEETVKQIKGAEPVI